MNKQSFLSEVAERILFLNKDNLIVILPNRRAGLFLKQEIAKQINQPIFLPKIVTIQDYMIGISGLVPIDSIEQLIRLYQSYRSIYKEESTSFEDFLSWAPTFLSDCGEIDMNLLETNGFFKHLIFDKEIRNWNLSEESTEQQKKYISFWKKAELLYNDYRGKLLKEQLSYNGLAYRVATDNLIQNIDDNNYYLFAGFNALNKAEEKLFEFIYDQQLGEFIWDYDTYYVNDRFNKAGQYVRDSYKSKFSLDKGLQNIQKKIGEKTEEIHIVESPNNTAQCEIVAHFVTELAKNGEFNEKTAIILADEQLLQPLLFQLPKRLGKYNITMGTTITQFSLYSFFETIIQLQKQLSLNQSGFSLSLLQPVLHYSLLKQIDYQSCKFLNDYLIDNNITFIKQADIDEQLPDESLLKQILQPKSNVESLTLSLISFIDRAKNISNLDGLTKEVLFEFNKVFQQFLNFQNQYGIKIGFTSFQKLFKQVSRSTSIPFEGEPLEGLQIMGVLESRCLDFDNVIFVSSNEGILPKGRIANSFIPYIFKKEFNIQTFQDKDAIYAYSIYRLLHHAKKVYFIYNGQPDVLGGGEESRFIQQIESEFHEHTGSKSPILRYSATFLNNKTLNDDYKIEKTKDILQNIQYYLEKIGLSPSALNLLIKSPLDFYFRYIVGIREPKEQTKDIEANTFGTIVHDTLESLYKPLIGKELTITDLENCENRIDSELTSVVNHVFKKGSTKKGKNRLKMIASKTLIEQAIALDKKRIQSNKIEIVALEEELECIIPLKVNGFDLFLKLRGKADRIQKKDGIIEVIDYKTGKVDQSKLTVEKIKNIDQNIELDKLNQLICYIIMLHYGEKNYPLNKINAGMQPLKSWQKGIHYIQGSSEPSLLSNRVDEYKEVLIRVLEGLLDPNTPFIPEDEETIKFSPFKRIYQ